MEIGFSLGSNEGDRLALLGDARRRLLAVPGTAELARSLVYETDPVGVEPRHRHLKFLNTVLVIGTSEPVDFWVTHMHRVETELGRVRGGDRYAPRTMDIDMLYADDLLYEGDTLVLPHPHWARRRFVVQPLADVRPDLVIPGAGGTVNEVLAGLPPEPRVWRAADSW